MKILITGANGFVGKNMVAALRNVMEGKDRTQRGLYIDKLYCYDIDSTAEELERYCADCDFVFHFAGVNRPTDPAEFMRGNYAFSALLLDALRRNNNTCPIVVSSSVQASLIGRYADGEYGKSKVAGENLFFDYADKTGATVLVYRFPNLFGKWCRPNYNSAVATFCYNTAHDKPLTVTDPTVELELLYIDDLIDEMLLALKGAPHRCDYDGLTPIFSASGRFCAATVTHRATLGEIVELLKQFSNQPNSLIIPSIPNGSFAKKLYSTYLSYLPKEKVCVPLRKNEDARGSFTELLRTEHCGQVSVNISKPGITKGEHWHHTKWEFFMVVSGEGLIRQREIGSDKVLDFYVSGDKPQAVHILPGYTHNIINLSQTDDLITVMWANECFDPSQPDTFFEPIVKE